METNVVTPMSDVVTSSDIAELRPDLMSAFGKFSAVMKSNRRLPDRLVELMRLRIAFRNQCRPCMSMRYASALEDGLTEEMVCSLERPDEPSDLSAAERTAIMFADKFASNHLSITIADRADLERHFSREQIAEIAICAAMFTGFGRMGAVFDTGGDYPVGQRNANGAPLTPWGITETIVVPQKGM